MISVRAIVMTEVVADADGTPTDQCHLRHPPDAPKDSVIGAPHLVGQPSRADYSSGSRDIGQWLTVPYKRGSEWICFTGRTANNVLAKTEIALRSPSIRKGYRCMGHSQH